MDISVYSNPKRRWRIEQFPPVHPDTKKSEEQLLHVAILGMLNCDRTSLSLHLEFLKGSLAQVSSQSKSAKVLVLAAEQLINTVSNTHWLDLEKMKTFFLDTVGFGMALSTRSAARCINAGIPSPQRLAILLELDSRDDKHALQWLNLTSIEASLLQQALKRYDFRGFRKSRSAMPQTELLTEAGTQVKIVPQGSSEAFAISCQECQGVDSVAFYECSTATGSFLPPTPPPSPAESVISSCCSCPAEAVGDHTNFCCKEGVRHLCSVNADRDDNERNYVQHDTKDLDQREKQEEFMHELQEKENSKLEFSDLENDYELVKLFDVPVRKAMIVKP